MNEHAYDNRLAELRSFFENFKEFTLIAFATCVAAALANSKSALDESQGAELEYLFFSLPHFFVLCIRFFHADLQLLRGEYDELINTGVASTGRDTTNLTARFYTDVGIATIHCLLLFLIATFAIEIEEFHLLAGLTLLLMLTDAVATLATTWLKREGVGARSWRGLLVNNTEGDENAQARRYWFLNNSVSSVIAGALLLLHGNLTGDAYKLVGILIASVLLINSVLAVVVGRRVMFPAWPPVLGGGKRL